MVSRSRTRIAFSWSLTSAGASSGKDGSTRSSTVIRPSATAMPTAVEVKLLVKEKRVWRGVAAYGGHPPPPPPRAARPRPKLVIPAVRPSAAPADAILLPGAFDPTLRNPGRCPRLRAEPPWRLLDQGSSVCGECPLNLERLGWTSSFEEAFRSFGEDGLTPGRISAGFTHLYRVLTGEGELLAEVAGRFRHQAGGPEDFPAVGDWGALEPRPHEGPAPIPALPPPQS